MSSGGSMQLTSLNKGWMNENSIFSHSVHYEKATASLCCPRLSDFFLFQHIKMVSPSSAWPQEISSWGCRHQTIQTRSFQPKCPIFVYIFQSVQSLAFDNHRWIWFNLNMRCRAVCVYVCVCGRWGEEHSASPVSVREESSLVQSPNFTAWMNFPSSALNDSGGALWEDWWGRIKCDSCDADIALRFVTVARCDINFYKTSKRQRKVNRCPCSMVEFERFIFKVVCCQWILENNIFSFTRCEKKPFTSFQSPRIRSFCL